MLQNRGLRIPTPNARDLLNVPNLQGAPIERRFSLTSTLVSGEPNAPWVLAGAVVALACVAAWIVFRKGRPFSAGDVFRASRLSSGNHLFPTQVLITSSNVVQFTPRWIGRQEESIHIAHVASVKIDTRLLLSDVLIETSGGVSPIVCHGHHKSDAIRMKALIEQHQNDYYREGGRSAADSPASPAAPADRAGAAGRGSAASDASSR
jgi:hypothetical protein